MRGNGLRIPNDVAEHVNKKRIGNILTFAAIEIFLIVLAIVYWENIFGGTYPAASYTIYVSLMIVPFFLLDIKFWMFDKSWVGEIVAKREKVYTSFDKGSVKNSSTRLQTNKEQRLDIKLDSGKIIEYILYDNKMRYAFRKTTYNVGDRVIHVGGTRYLQAVAVNDADTLICVVCGAESRVTCHKCPVCDKTLKIN